MRLATELQDNSTRRKPLTSKNPSNQSAHEVDCTHLESDPAEIAQHLALAARATNDAVRVWDVKSASLSWPQGLESLLGYTPSIISREIGFWQRHVHPEDRARTSAGIREAVEEGEHWSGEYRFRKCDGSYVLLLERALIERNDAGEAVRFVGSLMDITARKQLQDQVVRSQKMEAFGQLAGGVAHDFNNFLTTILGYSDLLLHELGLKGATANHVAEIRAAAMRASALTGQLLAFSRKHPLQRRVVEVNSVITNMERSLLGLLGENISVECHLHRAKEPAHINVDPGQLTQILLNLAVNARDAMDQSGRLTLGTATVRFDETRQPKGCEEPLAPGEYAMITVTDNGAGMNDAVKAHLFEPFFTTKEGGLGTGLGLATSYGIIRQSGGHICIESEIGKGTMVTIYLPKVAAPPTPTYKKLNGKKPAAGTETILVLEDDVGVRHISVRVLRSLGYAVIEAANGDDAQRLIALDGKTHIDLLLTDVVMPHMSGKDFADWLRTTSPRTKVIFISGYLDESLCPSDSRGDGRFFLPKPFDADQLATKVREALDSKS
ncbi:MAG TPA: ATP-binding protein [Chthoniobacterales bacterium]